MEPSRVTYMWGHSLALSLLGFLGFLQLLDLSDITYFATANHVTSPVVFKLGLSLTVPLGVLWALVAVWTTHRGGIYNTFFSGLFLVLTPFYMEWGLSLASLALVSLSLLNWRNIREFSVSLTAVICGIYLMSVLHWVAVMLLGIESPLGLFARTELSLFYLAAQFAPILVFPLLFMWAFNIVLRRGVPKMNGNYQNSTRIPLHGLAVILISVLASVMVAFYPYNPVVNPSGWNVGVDINDYVALSGRVAEDPRQAFSVLNGSRPTIFLMIYGLRGLTGLSITAIVRYMPVLLNPLLVLSSVFIGLEVFRDGSAAAWSGFFTAFGVQITVGMYSHFLADMLALSLTFLSLGLLFRALRLGDRRALAYSAILGALVPYTHPWTYVQYAVPLGLMLIYAAYKRIFRAENGFNLAYVMTYLACIGLAELSIRLYGGYGGIGAMGEVTRNFAGPLEWLTGAFGISLLYGGFMANLVLLAISVMGASRFSLARGREGYILLLLLASSAPYLLVGEMIKSRILYNLPFGLFMASGLLYTWENCNSRSERLSFTVFMALSMTAYLLHSIANIV